MLPQQLFDLLHFALGVHRQHPRLPVGAQRLPGGRVMAGAAVSGPQTDCRAGHHQLGAVGGHVPGKFRRQLVVTRLLVVGQIDRDALHFVVGDVLVAGQRRRLPLKDRRADQQAQVVMPPIRALQRGGQAQSERRVGARGNGAVRSRRQVMGFIKDSAGRSVTNPAWAWRPSRK